MPPHCHLPPTHRPEAVCLCFCWHQSAHVDLVPCWLKQDILPCQLPRSLFGRNISSILALLQVQSLCDLKFKLGPPLPSSTFQSHSPRSGCLTGTPGNGFLKRICMRDNFKGDSVGCDTRHARGRTGSGESKK